MGDWVRQHLERWLEKALRKIVSDIAQEAVDKAVGEFQQVAIDVNFREESQVIIVSRLDGGRIKMIPVRFNSVSEMEEFTRFVEQRYRAKSEVTVFDLPHGMRGYRRNW